jgi:cytochrome P450
MSGFALTQFFLLLIPSTLAYLAWLVFESTILSPLKHIPGPFLAKITKWWLIPIDLAGNRTATIDKLHKTYGPAVRIGPNEVSFSDKESIRQLYGQATVYMKAPIYETFSKPPVGIFSLLNKQEHAKRRRLLAHAFSQANLYDTEPQIIKMIDKAVANTQKSKDRTVNVLSLFRSLALDIVGELFLGKSFGALDQEKPLAYLEDVDRCFLVIGLEANFPLLITLFSKVPLPQVRHFLDAQNRLYQVGVIRSLKCETLLKSLVWP